MSKTQVQIPRYLNSRSNKSSAAEMLFTLWGAELPMSVLVPSLQTNEEGNLLCNANAEDFLRKFAQHSSSDTSTLTLRYFGERQHHRIDRWIEPSQLCPTLHIKKKKKKSSCNTQILKINSSRLP